MAIVDTAESAVADAGRRECYPKNGPDPLAQPPWPGWPDHFKTDPLNSPEASVSNSEDPFRAV